MVSTRTASKLATGIAMVVGCVAAAQAASPQASFEASIIGGVGNTVSMLQVPVLTSAGKIVYKDVTMSFTVRANGTLSLTAGSLKVTDSPTIATGNFIAGDYKYNGHIYTVSGPTIDAGGRTTWGLNGYCGFTAGWTSGPIAGHPQQARLDAAKISYAGYSYGTFGYGGCLGSPFGGGSLLGGAGGPNGLTLFSYTSNGIDKSAPVGSVNFTRCTTNPC